MTTTEEATPPDSGTLQAARSARRNAWLFPAAVLLLVAVLGTLKLSGSSIGVYALRADASEDDAGVLDGPVREIRSDEWAVRTPWVLRQVELGLPTHAAGGMGTHDVAVLSDLPTRSWELALRPHTAGYLVLDEERAFALEWWLLAAVQLLGVYALLYALTRRPAVSAVTASLLTLSPATQWWWAPGTFTTIGYGCLATALLIFAYRAQGHGRRVAWSLTAGWVIAAFLTTLYVPWQIGTGFVVGPVALATFAPDVIRRATRRKALASLALVGGVSLGLGGVLFGSFVVAHRDTIRTIAETEYPGAQPANVGGTANLAVLWGAAFDYFSSENPSATVNGTNQSENSSALLFLLPVALACFALGSAGLLRDHPLVPALLACLAGGAVLLTWMLLPVPGALARLALLTRAPPGRMFLPVGLASVLALGLFVAYQLDSGRRLRLSALVVCAGSFAAALAWGAGAYRRDGQPVDLMLALVFILVVSAGVALALGRRPLIGLGILAAFSFWQASLVNPVQLGTDPVGDSALRQAIEEVEAGAPARAGWIAFNAEATVKGTLTASGVNHLTGVSAYPDARTWRVLDPDLRHRQVWNRYAYVSFVPGPVGSPVTFTLVGPDGLAVTVDPCSPALSELGVSFFVIQDSELSACSEAIRRVPIGTGYVTLYRRVAPS